MDLSTLSRANFDVKEWVESILNEIREGNNLETFISTISMKLQLLSQDLNAELEKGLIDLMGSFPRAMAELDRLNLSSKDLKSELGHVLGQVEKTRGEKESDPEDPREVLAKLHQMRSHMEKCRDTLTEAANWNQLVREVNARFARGELTQVADQLGAMQKSLLILQNMPEAAERVKTMEQLESQLEVVLKPKVQAAIQKETIGALQEYTVLYRKLGRTEALYMEYARARPAQLHRFWFSYGADNRFKDWLPGFYKQVSDFLMEEKKRCAEVFGAQSASQVLTSLVIETFNPLADSYHNRLIHEGAHQPPFSDIVNLFGQTAQFLSSTCSIIGLSEEEIQGQGVETAPSKEGLSLASTLSSSSSIDPPPSAQENRLIPIITTVLDPYVDFVDRYESVEQAGLEAWLQRSLETIQEVMGTINTPFTTQMDEVLDVCTSAFPMVEALVDRSVETPWGYHTPSYLSNYLPINLPTYSAFSIVEALVDRSIKFSSGYHARELIRLIQRFLTSDMNRFSHIFIAARKHCKLATDKDGKPTSPLPTSPSAQGQGGTRGKLSSPPPSSSALPVIVPTPRQMLFDWEYLQGSLRLLQALGRHYRHLSSIERELLRILSQMYDWIFSTDKHHRSLSSSQPASSLLPPSSDNLNHKEGNLGLLAPSSSSAVEAAEGEEGSHFAANTTPISLLWVRTLLKDQPTERAELRGFLRVFTQPVLPGDLLKGPFRSASSQAAEARRLIFDVCMSLVRDRIQTVPSLQTWVAAPEEGAGKDIYDPSSAAYYSNLPQSYITQVGEHILSLIQHLEDFASSDALGEVSAVMAGLERLVEVDWRKSGQVLGMSEAELSSLITSTATTRDSFHHPPSSKSEDQEQGKEEEEEDGMMRFCNAWLSLISQATAGVLVTAVASIPRLTSRGSRQLQTDAAYLLTVLDNLEVKPHPALTFLHEIAGLKEEELAERIENRGSDSSVSTSSGGGASSLGVNAMNRKLERKLAASRGLVISFHG